MAESSPIAPKRRKTRGRSVNEPPGMSTSSGPMDEDLLCSICLDVFTDPVSTPCGHNFCKTCLNTYWNNIKYCRCPNCEETFNQRPDLKINTTLRDVVDHFKKKSHKKQAEVVCDICTEGKLKAVKSCLVCQSSFCETHLEPHLRVSGLQKHKLIDPVKNLQDFICQKHERPLELFCRDDQTHVCLSCTEGEHKFHNTVPLEEESKEKKKNAEKEKAAGVAVFADLIQSIERIQSELLKVMEEKQKAAEKHDKHLIKDLKQEITELKKRNIELQQILHTEDHLQLIQIHSSMCIPLNIKNCPEISMKGHVSVEKMLKSLNRLQKTLREKLSETELKWMQQYAVDVTLDPDTAHPGLTLSDDEKQVRHEDIRHKLTDNKKRFDRHLIVLGKEGFSSGRFYFEVQVKGKTDWDLGVAIESVNRKKDITRTPVKGFWTVALRNENEYKACAYPFVSLSLSVKPQKVGVFVDYEEGLVSFYDVESRSHIYSFTGQCFTGELYPCFSPCLSNKGNNSEPLIITPIN